ncbi:MAG TPA: methyltransferase domain-containing protein [Burkholderiaceae bacterium]|nr:methyltransferase domain-containing protein [Burkholderiaceae bacterium]
MSLCSCGRGFPVPIVWLTLSAAPASGASSAGGADADAQARMFAAGDAYDRFMGRWSRRLAPAFAEFAGVADGDRVLDVGTGTGALAAAVAAMTSRSEVVGIDPSPGFIAAATRNAGPRLKLERGDAQALPFPDRSFDRSMALLVMNFVPEPEQALREMRRVTRPGGGVSACVWDYDAGMQMLRIFWDEVVALDPAAEPRDERHMKLSRQGQLGALWRKAGLVDVQERPIEIEQAFTSFDDYWSPFVAGAGPAGAYAVSLPEDRRRQLAERVKARLLGDRNDRAFRLQARAWCVRGVVP